MQKKLGRNTVVLLGIGHTNAHVLRMWKMQSLANSQLVCVSNYPHATYSGMLPGVLAGQYPPEMMEIDLVRLCASAGARLVVAEVTGLDQQHHRLEFANRPPLYYDVLSIGIGSRPTFRGVEVVSPDPLVAVKPMQTFLDRLRKRFAQFRDGDRPVNIAIVGGGIGSIEIAFCLHRRLQNDPAFLRAGEVSQSVNLKVVTADSEVGTGLIDSTRQKVRQLFGSRGIGLTEGLKVTRIQADTLELENGSAVPADIVIWATGAAPPTLLDQFDLEKDRSGFLLTGSTLQSKSDERIFAVGDSATIENTNIAKAGVYAVRQGPFLWDNIQRLIWKRSLREYEPQHGFLKLINTADEKTIAEYKGLSVHAGWCWKLKDYIDSKFMGKYHDYEPMEMAAEEEDEDDVMRCLGCGGKIGSELLGQVIRELEVPAHPDVIVGLEHPDDAAVMRTHNSQVTVTTDFFASPFDDPYLVGRIALLNSASDCCVMGAQPTGALAMVELPLGHPRSQLRMMKEVMAGSVEELARMNATIVGGHSIEGPRLTIGFTVLGRQMTDPKTKGMLKPGDLLILTKPLGSGILLAGLMQAKLPFDAYLPLLETMLQSNYIALKLITDFKISGITDVTGFGLAGHLAEMLKASHVSAELQLENVPILPGCRELVDEGVESTLAPDNRLVTQQVYLDLDDIDAPQYAALFDPQTSGGLLFGVGETESQRVMEFLQSEGFTQSVVVGQVGEPVDDKPVLSVRS